MDEIFDEDDMRAIGDAIGHDVVDAFIDFMNRRFGPVLQLAAEGGQEAVVEARDALVDLLEAAARGLEEGA